MTVHATLTEVGPRWITVCHECGATQSHPDPRAADRAACPCKEDAP